LLGVLDVLPVELDVLPVELDVEVESVFAAVVSEDFFSAGLSSLTGLPALSALSGPVVLLRLSFL